jgi:hypothetical protein
VSTVHAGATLAAGLALTDLGIRDLWLRYLALGGSYSCADLGHYLRGHGDEWSASEHDMAAQAVNEETSDHGLDHPVSYANEA